MRKINLLDLLMQMILILLFAELVFPPLTTVGNANIICLLCIISWFCLSVIKQSIFYLKCPPYVIFSCVYLLLVTLIPYLMGYPVIGNRYLGHHMVVFGYIMYKFHQQNGTLYVVRNAIVVASILSIFTLLETGQSLLQSEFISRTIKSDGEYSRELAAAGIGGFSFIYYIAIMTPIVLQCFFLEREKKKKLFYAVGYLLCLFLVFKSNYATALLMTIISSLVLIFSKSFKGKQHPVVFCLGIIMSVLVMVVVWNAFEKEILYALPTRVAAIFKNSSGVTIWEQLATEFIRDRWPTMLSSFDAFISAPLLGIVASGDLQMINSGGYVLAGFGQHSYIVDTFALFGLCIGVLTIYLAFLPFRKRDRTKDVGFMYAVLLSTVIVYTFNNATNSIAYAVCIVYPYVRDNICKQTENCACKI